MGKKDSHYTPKITNMITKTHTGLNYHIAILNNIILLSLLLSLGLLS